MSKSVFQIYNTLTKTSARLQDKTVNWYICGPTVYDHAHIGHARTYMAFDMIRRIMTWAGTVPKIQMGITDIDDKIINRSHQKKLAFKEVAHEFEQSFIEDLHSLGIRLPDTFTRVSDNIDAIISFVSALIEKNFAYVARDGGVYFSLKNYSAQGFVYPKFRPKVSLESEVDFGASDKQHDSDFALWKVSKNIGDPGWDSPWGRGRPGWHIECSAMIHQVFGENIHLHSGGIDLQFPHHENEIAQSEAYYGKSPWCPIFFHTGHLHINGDKMSKSLGNFVSVKSLLKEYTSDEFRMMCIMTNYKSVLDFSTESLEHGRSQLKKIQAITHSINRAMLDNIERSCDALSLTDKQLLHKLCVLEHTIANLLLNDCNWAQAYSHIRSFLYQDVLSYIQALPHPVVLQRIQDYISNHFCLLGLGIQVQHGRPDIHTDQPEILDLLLEFRAGIRQLALRETSNPLSSQLLASSDQLRDQLLSSGYRVEDSKLTNK